MRPSHRPAILDAALRVLERDGGGDLSYDAVAREAELTKAGVMYHFATREDLVRAVVGHVAARWDAAMREVVGGDPAGATPAERVRAYVQVAVTSDPSRADVAVFADALYRPQHAAPWREAFEPWFDLAGCTDAEERARLTSARLAADGLWLARATDLFSPGRPGETDHDAVAARLLALTVPDPDAPPDAHPHRPTAEVPA